MGGSPFSGDGFGGMRTLNTFTHAHINGKNGSGYGNYLLRFRE